MDTTIKQDFSNMTKIEKYQHFTRKKLQEVENLYYPLVDELEQKLADINEVPEKFIPDFTLYTFSFVKEWQAGLVNTEFVLALLKSMNFQNVAEKQLTRRLTNFIHDKETNCVKTCDYVKEVRKQLIEKAVPAYVVYLGMLTKYFEKMYEIDQLQVKVTWLEQIFHSNGEVRSSVRDLSLNQVYRDLLSNVTPNGSHKYFVGKNVVVFDEDLTEKDAAVHWLFAPQSYIEQLKKSFNVVEEMSLLEEKAYIQKIIGAYIK